MIAMIARYLQVGSTPTKVLLLLPWIICFMMVRLDVLGGI